MITRRQAVLGTAALALPGVAGALGAEEGPPSASPWVAGLGARMRLLRGAPLSDKDGVDAGIEIGLEPGFRTYWRMPGDAGVPPVFDWSASSNLASIATDFPAPQRFNEAGVSVIGYGSNVVLPLRVTAADSSLPVGLALTLSYAACKTICVPLKAAATLSLAQEAPAGLYVSLIEAATREVPRRVEPAAFGLGEPQAVSLTLVEHGGSLALRPKLDADERILDIFVEAPGNWLFGAPVTKDATAKAELPHIELPLLDRPKRIDRAVEVPVTLTIVTDRRAVETMIGARPIL